MNGLNLINSYRDITVNNGEYVHNRFDKQKDIIEMSQKIKSNPNIWDDRYIIKNKQPQLKESRYFSILLYPMFNEKHFTALERLLQSKQSYLIAVHDKDITGAIYHNPKKYGNNINVWYNEDNQCKPAPKKIHCHVYLIVPNKGTYTSVANSLGIECNFVKPVEREFYRYLLHLDNTNKYQYADEYDRVICGSLDMVDTIRVAIDTPNISGIDAIIKVAEISEQYLYYCTPSEFLKDLKSSGFTSWLNNPANVRLALQFLDKQHKRIHNALKKDYDDWKTLWEAENENDLHLQCLANKKRFGKFKGVK